MTTRLQSEKLSMRCTCCLSILVLRQLDAIILYQCALAHLVYTRSGLVSLSEIPIHWSLPTWHWEWLTEREQSETWVHVYSFFICLLTLCQRCSLLIFPHFILIIHASERVQHDSNEVPIYPLSKGCCAATNIFPRIFLIKFRTRWDENCLVGHSNPLCNLIFSICTFAKNGCLSSHSQNVQRQRGEMLLMFKLSVFLFWLIRRNYIIIMLNSPSFE